MNNSEILKALFKNKAELEKRLNATDEAIKYFKNNAAPKNPKLRNPRKVFSKEELETLSGHILRIFYYNDGDYTWKPWELIFRLHKACPQYSTSFLTSFVNRKLNVLVADGTILKVSRGVYKYKNNLN